MARFVDAIDLPIPVEEAFDYLADFSRTAEWDPGVAEARCLTKGRPREGSRFEVTVAFLGQSIPLVYEIIEFDPPYRLVLSGGDSSLRSVDEMTFVERHGATRVTYEAKLELVGIRRFADPILDVLMQRVGRLAVRGLRERLSDPASVNPRRKSSAVPDGATRAARKKAPSRSRKPSERKRKNKQEPKTKGAAS